MLIQVILPFEKLAAGQKFIIANVGGIFEIRHITQVGHDVGKIHIKQGQYIVYEEYECSVLTLDQAIEVEDDPIKKLAYRILKEDPMALDAARDVLTC